MIVDPASAGTQNPAYELPAKKNLDIASGFFFFA